MNEKEHAKNGEDQRKKKKKGGDGGGRGERIWDMGLRRRAGPYNPTRNNTVVHCSVHLATDAHPDPPHP